MGDSERVPCWQQYNYFSDNAMKNRVPQTKKYRDKDESSSKVDFRALRQEQEPETRLAPAGWDKYYFFGCPGDKSKVAPVAQKGRRRPAAEGPRTFSMDEEVLEDDGRRLNSTSYEQSYNKEILTDKSFGRTEPSEKLSHIFPDGHVTYSDMYLERRKFEPIAAYTCL
eukprot:GEMP01055002.1.p1 GENE.GEMP01055002.1~~GEMP01055002.1.p1  ORF type:complete len:168 (+),score=33.92 GEMP01055002.1:79-582(+)